MYFEGNSWDVLCHPTQKSFAFVTENCRMLRETDFVQEIISKYTVHQFPNDINNMRKPENCGYFLSVSMDG